MLTNVLKSWAKHNNRHGLHLCRSALGRSARAAHAARNLEPQAAFWIAACLPISGLAPVIRQILLAVAEQLLPSPH